MSAELAAAVGHALGNGMLAPLDPGSRFAVLSAPPDAGFRALGAAPPLVECAFRPHALALAGFGLAPVRRLDAQALQAARIDAVVVPGTGQTAETLGLVARAARLAPEGHVVVAVANDRGAGGVGRSLGEAGPTLARASKHHAKVMLHRADGFSRTALDAWERAASLRPILDGRFQSRPGFFSWDRVDPGSALLAAHLGEVRGRVADLGAGWGYLAAALLERAPGLKTLDLHEADADALDAARASLAAIQARTGDARPVRAHWSDVARDLPPAAYDWVVTNPPFHSGGGANAALGRSFIAAAAKGLRRGGTLLLVANRQLPYEAALAGAFREVAPLADRGGFKVLRAVL